MQRVIVAIGLALATLAAGGCAPTYGQKAKYGITFYCPGAGNVDMGDAGLRQGLELSGYQGEVSRLTWTISFNPAIDQAVRLNARLGASRLATFIKEYLDEYPGREVNVVGLSAGTGVAIWALEDLPGGYQVNNVVLLSSSLSSDYDISKALGRVSGTIYCYYSPHDLVLAGPMKIFGTIDGKFGVDGAGAVGLHPPRGRDRVVNIRWRPEFERYGYAGGHMDSTSSEFVRHYVASHIVTARSAGLLETAGSRRLVAALRGETGEPLPASDEWNAEDVALHHRLSRMLLQPDAITLIAGSAEHPWDVGAREQLKNTLHGEECEGWASGAVRPTTPPPMPAVTPAEPADVPDPVERWKRVLAGEGGAVTDNPSLALREAEAARRLLTALEGDYRRPEIQLSADTQR